MTEIIWTVITTDCFNKWYEQQDEDTQDSVLAHLLMITTNRSIFG